ncbi:MAG TPA: helix-turn-helix domain-containing protein, partial [Streptosporangiaceae bacterium]|nr:helix-turn-helix domain-containing protein [Streptosporangiaceae bacterium]
MIGFARNPHLAGLGRLARYDASYLARLERGDQFATLAVAQACDQVLDAGGELVRSWHAADRDRRHAAGPAGEADLGLITVMPLHAVTA